MQPADEYFDLKGQNSGGSFLAYRNDFSLTLDVPFFYVEHEGTMHGAVLFGPGFSQTRVFSLDFSLKVNKHE